MREKDINVHRGVFAIVKAKAPMKNAFANIRYGSEVTSIIDESKIEKRKVMKIEKGYGLISFDVVLPFNLVGFIASVSSALAREKIPIFVISSYSTDHILIKREHLEKAVKTLKRLK